MVWLLLFFPQRDLMERRLSLGSCDGQEQRLPLEARMPDRSEQSERRRQIPLGTLSSAHAIAVQPRRGIFLSPFRRSPPKNRGGSLPLPWVVSSVRLTRTSDKLDNVNTVS